MIWSYTVCKVRYNECLVLNEVLDTFHKFYSIYDNFQVLREVFGDMLFYPTKEQRPPVEFLSPESLKGYIIVSDQPPADNLEDQVINFKTNITKEKKKQSSLCKWQLVCTFEV